MARPRDDRAGRMFGARPTVATVVGSRSELAVPCP